MKQGSAVYPGARWFRLPVLAALLAVALGGFFLHNQWRASAAKRNLRSFSLNVPREVLPVAEPRLQPDRDRIRAPELEGGLEWLNCAGPIRMADLRGKVVLLDFWTYCCINCIHVMPDLARLEKKYPNQLVVIGVHSAKFLTEKDSKNIKDAILRYNIEHPVVNDADHKIWNAYAVRSWPTFWLIDPEGYLVGRGSGEGLFEPLDQAIDKLIMEHRAKKTLNEEPIRFDLAKFRARKHSPLYFPGKVLADAAGNRLFIADSSHHRIVITDLAGKKLDVAGTGQDGKADGGFDQATFNDPQGMAFRNDTLYVADRKNHLLRALDLKARKVKTIAGVGVQSHDRKSEGPADVMGLNSPWDLWLDGDSLYIAMAGHHQIWRMDLKNNRIGPFAGTGQEDIADGTLSRSLFAQPSGLASDGQNLYVADSEVSAVRSVSLKEDGKVKTLIGEGLFDFGDVDGPADQARLQHPLGVAFHEGSVYVADTYNNKIKKIDPARRTSHTFLGDGKPGSSDNPPRFDEPAGLCAAGDRLYVADTNNHRIRVIDLKTKEVKTLPLEGVSPPRPIEASRRPGFPNAVVSKLPDVSVASDGDLTLQVKLSLPPGFKLSPMAPIQYLVEAAEAGLEQIGTAEAVAETLEIKVPSDKVARAKLLRLSLVYHSCREGSEGVCQVKSQIWEIPLRLDPASKERVIQLTAGKKS